MKTVFSTTPARLAISITLTASKPAFGEQFRGGVDDPGPGLLPAQLARARARGRPGDGVASPAAGSGGGAGAGGSGSDRGGTARMTAPVGGVGGVRSGAGAPASAADDGPGRAVVRGKAWATPVTCATLVTSR